MSAINLTAEEVEHLGEVILNLHGAALQEGMAIERDGDRDHRFRRRTALHHNRSLDILYPSTQALEPVVPIESLAPDAGEAGALASKAEGYGPWSQADVEAFDRWVAEQEENYL